MFTGLVEHVGTIQRIDQDEGHVRLSVSAPFKEVQLGDSIAIDGCCLTVASQDDDQFQFHVSRESLQVTALGEFREGTKVNMERALRMGDRLGGHMVSGHVDGVGTVVSKEDLNDGLLLKVKIPDELTRYVVPKGSICLDGVSLTVNRLEGTAIELMLIPTTLKETTLGERPLGRPINVEVDLIGKYIERLVAPYGETHRKSVEKS